MIARLRTPFFIAALIVLLLVLLIETGSGMVVATLGQQASNGVQGIAAALPAGEVRDAFADLDEDQREQLTALEDSPPGMAILSLALLDGVLLFTVLLMGLGMLSGERIHARTQGCLTLIFSVLLLLGAIAAVLAALGLTLLMIALLLSVPFGTLTYFALYGFFNRGAASLILSLLMLFKIGFAVCLVLAQQRFLQNRGLMVMLACSLIGNILISFLHGFVPGFLVSITDGIGAILLGVCGLIWGLFLLLGSLGSVLKALRVDRL